MKCLEEARRIGMPKSAVEVAIDRVIADLTIDIFADRGCIMY